MVKSLVEATEILQDKLGVDIPSFVFWIIVILLICVAIRLLWQNEISPFIKAIQSINEKLIKTDRIDLLEHKQAQDAIDFRTADKEIHEQIDALTEKIDKLSNTLDKKIDHDNSVKRGELKDRIRQNYGYYHARQYITKMELEALEGLIRAYEQSGGENSFVHSVVEPEMYTWDMK